MRDLLFYAGVLLAAFGESTAIVGLVVPGVGVVVAAGVLAARGEGDLIGAALAASLGSIAGFGLSFHLGRIGGQRLSRWSLRAHAAIERSQAFLDRFGGWAVFWGHFFGPVRACVALVAGAGGLSPLRFWPASALGGLAWGFGLVASGAALSGGWRVIEGVLGRGSLLVAAIVVMLYASLRISAGALALGVRNLVPLSKWATDALRRFADSPRLRALGPAHPAVLDWIRRRLSPDRATGLLLSVGAALCGVFAALFFGIAEGSSFREPLEQLDLHLFHLLQTLRSPDGDRVFLWITYLGSGPVVTVAAATGASALVALRRRFEASLLFFGFGGGELLMTGLKLAFARPRPLPTLFPPSEATAAFPSNHAFTAVALFGFLCYLFSRGLRPGTRARLSAWTGVAIVAVGVSRLYLGAHWASDVAAGYTLGAIWLTAQVVGAEARRRFGSPFANPSPRVELACGAAVLALVLGFWVALASQKAPVDLARAEAPAERPRVLSAQGLAPALRELTANPVETLSGEPLGPVTVFVLAPGASLRSILGERPWTTAAELRLSALLQRWVQAWKGALGVDAAAYPRFWLGRPQELSFALADGRGGRWVARCWKSGMTLEDGRDIWAVWLRDEPPARRFLGIPVRGAGHRPPVRAGAELLSETPIAAGRLARVELSEPVPVEVWTVPSPPVK